MAGTEPTQGSWFEQTFHVCLESFILRIGADDPAGLVEQQDRGELVDPVAHELVTSPILAVEIFRPWQILLPNDALHLLLHGREFGRLAVFAFAGLVGRALRRDARDLEALVVVVRIELL